MEMDIDSPAVDVQKTDEDLHMHVSDMGVKFVRAIPTKRSLLRNIYSLFICR